jgi:hypothetical protein
MTVRYVVLPDALIAAWPKLSPPAKAVAVALASCMNAEGECWPSVAALRGRSGIQKAHTLAAAVAELVDAHLVEVHWRARRSRSFAWAKVPPGGIIENKAVAAPPAATAPPAVPECQDAPPDAPEGAGRDKRARSDKGPPKGNVWCWWICANREAGHDDPLRLGPDLGAARELGRLVASGQITEADLRGCMALYLADGDAWVVKHGHALRHLPGRIGAYRNRVKELEPPPLDPALVERIEAETT